MMLLLLSMRRGLIRGAIAGIVVSGLMIAWLVLAPLLMRRDANLEGLIIGAYGLALPVSLVIRVPDNLHYVLSWLMLVALVPINWALIGAFIVALWRGIAAALTTSSHRD